MQGDAYFAAGLNGDMATLRCLRQLGCPFSTDATTFTEAVAMWHGGLGALQWLRDQGCPVDWVAAREAARVRAATDPAFDPAILAWIELQAEPAMWLRGEAVKLVVGAMQAAGDGR